MSHTTRRVPALLLAGTLVSVGVSADESARSPDASDTAPVAPSPRDGLSVPQISRLQRLAETLNAVETNGGELLFISGNGRYVIRGQIADLWHGAMINSYDELVARAGRLDLGRMGVDGDALGALVVGAESATPTTVFIDPRCPHCVQLLEQLDDESLLERNQFALVLLPILGRESQQDALRLSCLAESDPGAAVQALLDGSVADLPLPNAASTCGQEPLQRALVAAQMLGISGTPFLVAPDGRTHTGATDLAAWLAATDHAARTQ
jgi:thiol:disulfide interchange protein DsbC